MAQPEDMPELSAENIEASSRGDGLAVDYEPWNVDVDRRTLSGVALRNMAEFVDRETHTGHTAQFTLFIEPSIPANRRSYFEEIVEYAILPLAGYLPEHTYVVLGTTSDFLVKTVEENGLTMPLSDGEPCLKSYGGCSWGDTMWVGGGTRASSYDGSQSGYPLYVVHQLAHLWQDHLFPDLGGQIPPRDRENFQAVWFIEGTAEFYSRAILDLVGFFDYTPLNLYALDLRGVEEWGGGGDPYPQGLFALELLVASVGFDAVLDIYRHLADGVVFEEAFFLATSISLEDFYDVAHTFDLRPAHRR